MDGADTDRGLAASRPRHWPPTLSMTRHGSWSRIAPWVDRWPVCRPFTHSAEGA